MDERRSHASIAHEPLPAAHTGHDYIGTDANQVFIQLGQPAVSRTSRDYDAFIVLSQIVGGSGSFESRLWQELRQKRGLVYSVSSAMKSDPDRGDFEIELNASPQHVAPAVAIVREQLRTAAHAAGYATELRRSQSATGLRSAAG